MRLKILLSVSALVFAALAHTQVLDRHGLMVTHDGLSRALLTFGVSRGLNGVISVVQGTEVAVEPVGIGMTFTPGQILDPVNDLVERFSTVVLVAATAFGLQRVALEVTATQIYSWLTSIALIVAVLTLWLRPKLPAWFCSAIYKGALILLIVRFAVPVMAIGGEAFYQAFLAPQFAESSAQLSQTSADLSELQTSASAESIAESTSLLDSARKFMQSASSALDVRQHIEDFKIAAETISEHAIRLMVVFIFQTVVLPLLSIWLVLKALRAVIIFKRV